MSIILDGFTHDPGTGTGGGGGVAPGSSLAHPNLTDYEDVSDQAGDPANPGAGAHRVYTKAAGVFVKDSTGTVVGPLAAAGSVPAGASLTHPVVTDYEDATDQGADPANPAVSTHRIYTKAGGLFVKDSTGAVVGPLIASVPAGSSLAHPALTDYEDATDQGADPANPGAGAHRIYTKAGGVFVKDSTGAVVGPLSGSGVPQASTISQPVIPDYEDFQDQAGDPANPAASTRRLYSKSGGLYYKSSGGTVVGPLAAGGGGATAPFQFAPDFQAPQSGDYAQMRMSVATTITALHAQRTAGTGATIDVLKNGVSILTAPLSLTATTDMTGALGASPNFAAGDICKIVLSGVSGSPSDIMASLDGTRLTV